MVVVVAFIIVVDVVVVVVLLCATMIFVVVVIERIVIGGTRNDNIRGGHGGNQVRSRFFVITECHGQQNNHLVIGSSEMALV